MEEDAGPAAHTTGVNNDRKFTSGNLKFFPAALVTFADNLAGADALELLATASDPASATRPSTS